MRWLYIRVSRLSVDTGGSFSLAIAHNARIKFFNLEVRCGEVEDDSKLVVCEGGWARVGLLVVISGCVIIYICPVLD